VIDEKALFKVLDEGLIAGAGLDVFEDEPLETDSLLLELDNVVVTPHIASSSFETRKKMAVVAATNLVNVLQGKTPKNLVNPEVMKIRLQENSRS
jgi:phosphoglycerate dehydrogenase-like enzyme